MTSNTHSHKRPANVPHFLFGATYYPEHWEVDVRELDADRMADAGFNCVRMGEFAWDRMEPEEGTYQFDLFDQTIAELGDRGISTIMGTPTATPPRWLTFGHPEVLRVDADGISMQHGSRQHACPSSDLFRHYSRKITLAMAEHFVENPHVIGWQIDNELNCHFSECHCPNCQAAFQAFLQENYQDIEALNAAWGNSFWALTYQDFAQIPTPKPGKPAYPNPAHRLDYYRFISWNIARFQREQVEILREVNPRWFVTHNGTFAHIDYRGPFGRDLDFLSYDVYPFFDTDPEHRLISQAFNLDHARAWTGNFMIPEQQSGPGGQGSYLHDTPEPGEIRRMAYTSLARGADSLLFFRWRTCRFGAESYWCGILDHDNVSRRRYEEVATLGEELETIGPELLNTHVRVDVGIATSDVDVYDAHDTLSLGLPSPKSMAEAIHAVFLQQGYAVGCVHPSDDLSGLKVYVIPHWALFDDAWTSNLRAYVENGGLLVIGARTATKNWQNNVIGETPPGPLARLAGVKIADYGRQNAPDKRPLGIRLFQPEQVNVHTRHWYEQLDILPGARTLGRWDVGHLKLKPAITLRSVGEGGVMYVGTYLTPSMIEALIPVLQSHVEGLEPVWPAAPEGVQVVVRENDEKRLWFFINGNDQVTPVPEIPQGDNLIKGLHTKSRVYLHKHEVLVIKEAVD
jgi:beta-galactosidase